MLRRGSKITVMWVDIVEHDAADPREAAPEFRETRGFFYGYTKFSWFGRTIKALVLYKDKPIPMGTKKPDLSQAGWSCFPKGCIIQVIHEES